MFWNKVRVTVICLNISFLAGFFHFFHVYMKKKNSNPSLKKRSLDISLQHKNRASNKFSKKKLFSAENRLGSERVNDVYLSAGDDHSPPDE